MYQWGDPYTDDRSWELLKPGAQVRVKMGTLPRPGSVGTLETIDDEDGYHVKFKDDIVVVYDGDMLIEVK